jgi:hypothetical protein
MNAQPSRAIQYLYFLRFSLLIWLFPVLFAIADSGWLRFSTRTLSRGIFVPEYSAGYCCVSFFLVIKGFVSLITARIVVLNGHDRFQVPPPDWVKGMLANDKARLEFVPLLLSQVWTVFTFAYLLLVGISEGVTWSKIVSGILWGVISAVLFSYIVNAWYYLAYEPPDGSSPPGRALAPVKLQLGTNAARTILFPRICFRLNPPGTTLPNSRKTLEDITTALRDSWFSRASQQLARWLGSRMDLSGYTDKTCRVFEAQIFAFIATIAFAVFFWILYPLTAPTANEGVRLSVLALLCFLALILAVIVSGTGVERKLLWTWKIALSAGSVVFCTIVLTLYVRTASDRFPVMASILLLVVVMGWIFSGLAFFFDRYRIPVFTMFLLVTLIPRILHWYGNSEDHYASTISLNASDSASLDLLTPAQILD